MGPPPILPLLSCYCVGDSRFLCPFGQDKSYTKMCLFSILTLGDLRQSALRCAFPPGRWGNPPQSGSVTPAAWSRGPQHRTQRTSSLLPTSTLQPWDTAPAHLPDSGFISWASEVSADQSDPYS